MRSDLRATSLCFTLLSRLLWTVGLIMLIASLLVVFSASHKVSAAQTVPYKVNFQGKLTNSAGSSLADGSYNMKLSLYSVSTAGTAVWSETRETTNRVTVSNGLFTIQLGDVTALSPSVFTSYPLYLEVELPTPATATCGTAGCASWTEGAMTPRQPLASSPYAMNADTLDGIDSATFARQDTANVFTGAQTIANTANSTAAFSIQRAAGGEVFLRADTSNNQLVLGDATGTDTSTTLLVVDSATADPTTGVVNGAIYYNTTTNKFRCRQGGAFVDCIGSAGGGSQRVTLVPEYAGAVLTADGSSNSVNVTSSSVSGLTSAQGYKHNFYQWDTTSTSAQDYDIVVNYQLPSNFSSFVTGSFNIWTYADSLTSTDATFMVKSSTGALCYVSAVSVKPAAAAAWENKLPGDPGNGCTFAANDIITFVIKPTVIQPSTNKVKIGEFSFAYQ